MNVQEYLSNFYKGTKNPTLKAMKYFMEEFGHPEKHLKAIRQRDGVFVCFSDIIPVLLSKINLKTR